MSIRNLSIRNLTATLLTILFICLFAFDANAETMPPQTGFYVDSIGVTGDNEIGIDWRLVRDDGSTATWESYVNFNYRIGYVNFLDWWMVDGELTDNEVIFWANRQESIERALNGAGLAAIDYIHTTPEVNSFIYNWSEMYHGNCIERSHSDGNFSYIYFEDCSHITRNAR